MFLRYPNLRADPIFFRMEDTCTLYICVQSTKVTVQSIEATLELSSEHYSQPPSSFIARSSFPKMLIALLNPT